MSSSLECTPSFPDGWPVAKKTAFFTLSLSVLFIILDYMDRQVLAALFPYLKEEYQLTDTHLGMLVSVVNISISILVIPSGYLIDRWSRSKLMGIMTFVWSVATGACAFAGSFSHLLVARLFVGAGEAGYSPAAQSLLAASFPGHLRSTVMSVFLFGYKIGAPLGLVVGAYVASHWGWRHAFGLVAIPGILGAFLCVFIKDFKTVAPVCLDDEKEEEKTRKALSGSYLHTVLSLLGTPTLVFTFLAQAFTLMCDATLMNWLPSYFNRVAGMETTRASALSALWLLSTAVAVLVGGPIFDWIRKRSHVRAAWCQAAGCFIAFGMMVAGFGLARPGGATQVLLLMGASFFFAPLISLGYTITADLSMPHQRGVSISLLVTAQNILGMAVGPLLAGMLSDHFHDLSKSLIVMSGCFALSGLLYIGVSLFYNRDFARLPKVAVEF